MTSCSYPPHFTMEIEIEELREKLKAREATDTYNPMRAMLLRLFCGSMLNDLKEGKVDKVIDDLEIGVARLDALEDEKKRVDKLRAEVAQWPPVGPG